MMIRPATPAELRSALADLAIRAAAFARGRGRDRQRELLLESISAANQYLGAVDAPADLRDPEAFVVAYLAAGGDWQRLVAAVNRAALAGATRRVS
jgi:hypothetical protein